MFFNLFWLILRETLCLIKFLMKLHLISNTLKEYLKIGNKQNSTFKKLRSWHSVPFSSVQSFSRVQLFVTPWIAACQASLSITNSPNPCPLNRWCHPTISSSVIPFSSCLQSFPASGSFPMSQLFASGGQSIGDSASTSVLPRNTQDWSPLGWTGIAFP